ncbi:MAG: extracellular solute-binding protein [Clostridiales bacterium]|jgi:putative aldouronate transport system substrate-binding protein|nr:extracellular solute-binding protein [Clostridiales bacterium]
MKTVSKTISKALACLLLVTLLASCGGPSATPPPVTPSTLPAVVTPTPAPEEPAGGGPVSITVEIFDRSNDGGSKPEDNFYTDFIKEGVLRDHNIEVTFVPVPRWTEVEQLNNLLAAGDAPDICVTYSYPTIQTYANMGAVLDMAPYLEDNKAQLPNLWGLLGETNIYWDKDPETGEIWAIEALLRHNPRIGTFVRQDWLTKLNIAEPTTLEEFEAMLYAFKENAETLLGADADKIIPFSTSYDVGWRADHLMTMFVADDITDKDVYINGFDDRHFLLPGIKEGIRVLNKWYNDGLTWNDFPLYGSGDTTEDNLIKSGYVGSFMHNWDYPYRNGEEGIHHQLRAIAGEDAVYTSVEPFKNAAGVYRKFLPGPIDRKVFLPATNDEPVASMLYLDWLSTVENRKFLQIGEEGVTHEVLEDGAIKTVAVTGEKIMNSPNNIDYTIIINGLDLGDPELTMDSYAYNYSGVDASLVQKGYEISINDGRIGKNVQVGQITAEEGMGPVLTEKRDIVLDQAVIAPVDQFDAVFDAGMQDYLASGGQAIIDERTAAWEKVFGDAVSLD